MSKKLIINADDYGISNEVNDAIESLINAGKLLDVSVIANAWPCEQAAAFLKKNPQCSVGVHLNVVEGVALSPSDGVKILMGSHGQFVNLRQLFTRWMRSPIAVSRAVETEWRAQIELLSRDGLTITHADSHQHVHGFPPFWRILTGLCREYGIPAVRVPREKNSLGLRSLAAFALGRSVTAALFLSRTGSLATNDHFLGFKRAGAYGEAEMTSDLKELKHGVTELIVHPSLYDHMPYPKMRGEMEYNTLMSNGLPQQIQGSDVELISWADVVAQSNGVRD